MKLLTIIFTLALLFILAMALAPGVYFHLSRIGENTADINRLRAEVRLLQQHKFTIRICPDKFGRFDFQIEEVK